MPPTRSSLLRAGAFAAEDILKRVYSVDVRKALDPTKDRDYLVLVGRLTDELAAATDDDERRAIQAVIDDLARKDWKSMVPEERLKHIATAVGVVAAVGRIAGKKVVRVFERAAKAIITATKERVSGKYELGLASTFTAKDEKVSGRVASAQEHYIRDAYGRRSEQASEIARGVVSRGVREGLGPIGLAGELKTALGVLGTRSTSYYRVAAGAFINRARGYAALDSYNEVGISQYRFDAVLDEVTTLACRMLHGRTFDVSVALQKYSAVSESEDPEDVRFITPWLSDAVDEDGGTYLYYKDKSGERVRVANVTENAMGQRDAKGSFKPTLSDGELSARGVTMPPVHGNCRSRITPVF